MYETIKTIISNKNISFILSTRGDYICCVLPRYDAYLFSQAMKESITQKNSINFETNCMNVDILNLAGTFIIDCTHKITNINFQITCIKGEELAEKIEKAAIKGKEEFGSANECSSKWGVFKALSDSA